MIKHFGAREAWTCCQYPFVVLLVLFQILLLVPTVQGNEYKGFKKLRPEECTQADDKVMSQLPSNWQKYTGYVKICNLRKWNSKSEISVISIWVNEYYEAKFPSPAPHVWEDFPLPIIVNDAFHKIGDLPEIYPIDDITSPVIYYGKWQNSIPTEIRVDVKNPAEGGNYYYAPLIYNQNKGRYEMKHKEIFNGRRQ